MAYSNYQQSRLEAGLCLACGVVRGEGSTKTRCSACAEKMREWNRQHPNRPRRLSDRTQENIRRYHARWYVERVAAGLCTMCGGGLPAKEKLQGLVCTDCCTRRKLCAARSRQKKRDKAAGIPEGNAYHWPHAVLPVLPKGGGASVRCYLDSNANAALLNLWAKYRDSEIAAGRQPHNRRVGQLVREAIHQWKGRLIGPSPYPDTLMVRSLTVYLDSETLRILEWQARGCFKNNKSAALRMILIAVGYPRPVPVAVSRRRDKWYEEE